MLVIVSRTEFTLSKNLAKNRLGDGLIDAGNRA